MGKRKRMTRRERREEKRRPDVAVGYPRGFDTPEEAIIAAVLWKLVSRTAALVFLVVWVVVIIPVVVASLKGRRTAKDDQGGTAA